METLKTNQKSGTLDTQTQQYLIDQQEADKLLANNLQLKKELEREKTLHNMLYKEWKQLSEQMSAKDEEVYENSRPKNLFYKYAFYVLLVAGIPGGYFAYAHIRNGAKISSSVSSSQVVSDSAGIAANTKSANATVSVNDSQHKQKYSPAIPEKPSSSGTSKEQTAIEQPIIQPLEKKVTPPDSAKKVKTIPRKPLVEKPLTDDETDSISSDGFNAYFEHRRNPFRKSSERYKVWAQGWNEGKAGAIKVLEKNPSLKH